MFGNFDPPVAVGPLPPPPPPTSPYSNRDDPLDVDHNTVVSPRDAALVINSLNAYGFGPLPGSVQGDSQYMPPLVYLDASGDGFVAPRDALLVINFLSENALRSGAETEGESQSVRRDGGTATTVILVSGFWLSDAFSQYETSANTFDWE